MSFLHRRAWAKPMTGNFALKETPFEPNENISVGAVDAGSGFGINEKKVRESMPPKGRKPKVTQTAQPTPTPPQAGAPPKGPSKGKEPPSREKILAEIAKCLAVDKKK